MKLTIKDTTYDVDMKPLEQRARDQIEALIGGKENGSETLRMLVKQACNFALPFLGIQKQSRNDDPIRLVIDKLVTMIFGGLESAGLKLEGTVITEPEPDKEAAAKEG